MQEENITVQKIQELFAQHGAGKAQDSPIKIHEIQELKPKRSNLQKIGEGGQACVYLSQQRGVKYAIKIFKLKQQQQDLINDFYNECKAFLSVNNEFVLRIIGYSMDVSREDRYCFCYYTHYYEKESLYDIIKKNSLLPDLEKGSLKRFVAKLKMIYEISQGLNAIHQANLTHRDIKCQNILLDDKDSPKIADLGLAREQNSSQTSSLKGTFKYMAPETFEGKINKKSNI